MARQALSLPFSGAALREVRERAGITLVTLAKRCAENGRQVHSSTLGKIESELHKPSPELLRALTLALDVELDDLLDQATDTSAAKQ